MREEWKKLPVFKKATEIQELVQHIVKVVESSNTEFEDKIEKDIIKSHLFYLLRNSLIIPAKIAGVSNSDMPYDIKMENATLIRKAAKEFIMDARGLQIHGCNDIEYLNLIRNEVDEFRVLFAEWVKTFDCWNYTIDRWGLFNPPGINYEDKDPDQDIPFDTE
ncbi:hypothetical protein [Bizionia arctica]|uniref:Uncharacterized protein n=1 Tax=Bizionia arctica TaxID=1495645 RepID=A0A917GTM4_9FLAO|nr:hypothetical protein [Bizionia arctica]GGG56884.1 hypothetical protein GCM10010976_29630 [Bizionia arctica]